MLILSIALSAGLFGKLRGAYYKQAVDEDREVDAQTATGLHADDYWFEVQTTIRSRVNHYRFVVVAYSGLCVDQYWSPRRPILGCCSA